MRKPPAYHSLKASPAGALASGTIIFQHYQVVRYLGFGGMGVVYECTHQKLTNHRAAVKILWQHLANNPIFVQRFQREIMCSYQVASSFVVRAYEYLQEDGLIGFAMEYVNGQTLRTHLADCGKLSLPDTVKIIDQTCSGLIAIHNAGITHRDLKPDNILISQNGDVKISDFGIARNQAMPALTPEDCPIGTLEYLAPEYILDKCIDQRSDIYALGLVTYELLVGKRLAQSLPYGQSQDSTAEERVEQDLKTQPRHVTLSIKRAIAREPSDRFQNARDFAEALAGKEAIPSLEQIKISKNSTARTFNLASLFHQSLLLFSVLAIASVLAITIGLPYLTKFVVTMDQPSAIYLDQPANIKIEQLPSEANSLLPVPALNRSLSVPTPQNNKQLRPTRLRLIGEPMGVFERSSGLYLKNISAKIRNVGEVSAEEITVEAKVPGGKIVKLQGPTQLPKNVEITYSLDIYEAITSNEKISVRFSCMNCRK